LRSCRRCRSSPPSRSGARRLRLAGASSLLPRGRAQCSTGGRRPLRRHPATPAAALPPPQEAQQDATASFERYIDDCSEKDWAQDKRRLFSIVAPHTGLEAAAAGDARHGSPAGALRLRPWRRRAELRCLLRRRLALGRTILRRAHPQGLPAPAPSRQPPPTPPPARPPARAGAYAAATGQAPGGLKASPKERAYIEVVRRLNEAATAGQPFSAAAEFAKACQQHEEKGAPPRHPPACLRARLPATLWQPSAGAACSLPPTPGRRR
jgi:hypothetical protein